MKAVLFGSVFLVLCYLVQGVPTDESENDRLRKILKDAVEKCGKKNGVSENPRPPVESWTEAEKCFKACMLQELGAMRADGSFNEDFVHPALQLENATPEKKAEIRKSYSDCIKGLPTGGNKCETTAQFYKCFVKKN